MRDLKNPVIAVVGATGAVGTRLLSIMEQRNFPLGSLVPFASERSLGSLIKFRNKQYPCQVLKDGCFQGVDIAFFDCSDEISKIWALPAAQAGAWVVDNSAVFRLDKDIPLLVPEINGAEINSRLKGPHHPRTKILSGPNCSTVQLVMALKPIQDRWGLKRVVVSTYQSVSGAGRAAMDEAQDQTRNVLEGKPIRPVAFAHQIAFNCIPQIGGFKSDGYTSEESKIIQECRKILGLPELKITATAVRVPSLICHCESVNIECERPFSLPDVRAALSSFSGIVVIDEPQDLSYPLPLVEAGCNFPQATDQDPVYVGRIRIDESAPNALNLWVVSDNLRKGAALNAIQIGEGLIGCLGA